MPAPLKRSSPEARLPAALGPAFPIWGDLTKALAAEFPPVVHQWKPTKLEFGLVCLVNQKERTLVYLIPANHQFEVSVVLGNRAAALALEGDLPSKIKKLITEARVYAEGRGIGFAVSSPEDAASVVKLVRFKITPK